MRQQSSCPPNVDQASKDILVYYLFIPTCVFTFIKEGEESTEVQESAFSAFIKCYFGTQVIGQNTSHGCA